MAKLYFRFAAMNAGKSTALLQVAHNYEEQGGRALIYTAQVDDRYGAGKVTSRLGVNAAAAVFDQETDFFACLAGLAALPECVLIDEAHFLKAEQVKQLHRAAHDLDLAVIAYGLRSDFMGRPFEGSSWLLTLADDLEELKTICRCGKKATMNIRLTQGGQVAVAGEQVQIGGNDRYKSVCARCYYAKTGVIRAPRLNAMEITSI